MTQIQMIAWPLMAVQMIAWFWMQKNGGDLPGRRYIVFCAGLMIGQVGSSIECTSMQAWGTLVVQVYFFTATGYGAYRRWRFMRMPVATT